MLGYFINVHKDTLCSYRELKKESLYFKLPLAFSIKWGHLTECWQNSFMRLLQEHPKIENRRTSVASWRNLSIRRVWELVPAGTATRRPAEFHLDWASEPPWLPMHHCTLSGFHLLHFSGCHLSAQTRSLFHVCPALFFSSDF